VELKQNRQPQQKTAPGKPNLTGIPLQMKQSFERSSGLSFDDVRVHYRSTLPSQLGALAYTQGAHVYIAPGQERHLGHELGHVVQQKQGRVQATSQLGGVKRNTSPAMEQEADALCRQAEQGMSQPIQRRQAPASEVVQMKRYTSIHEMLADICGEAEANETEALIREDPVLSELYDDAEEQIGYCDISGNKKSIQITALASTAAPRKYQVDYTKYPGSDPKAPFESKWFIGALLHELGHAAVDTQYRQGVPGAEPAAEDRFLNLNLPPMPVRPDTSGKTEAEIAAEERAYEAEQAAYRGVFTSADDLFRNNIARLREAGRRDEAKLRKKAQKKQKNQNVYEYLFGDGAGHTNRIDYMQSDYPYHYDVVLGEMMYHLQTIDATDTATYQLLREMLQEANDRRHQRRGVFNQRLFSFAEGGHYPVPPMNRHVPTSGGSEVGCVVL